MTAILSPIADPQDQATVSQLFRCMAEQHADRTALVFEQTQLTFAGLYARAERVAAGLRAHCVGKDGVVATLLQDGPAMIELLIATARVGATVLALNWRLAPSEIDCALADAQPSLLISDAAFGPLTEQLSAEVPRITLVDPLNLTGVLGGSEHPEDYEDPTPSDRWYLIYTSGTTGRAKGCQHTQGGYFTNALALAAVQRITSRDICLLTQPLFHVGGLCMFLSWHIAGAAIVIPPRQLTAEALLRLVQREGITVLPIPILNREAFFQAQEHLRLPLNVRLLTGGSGRNDPAMLARVGEMLGADMWLGYGQSEAGGVCLSIDLAEQLAHPSACGKPLPHLRARIVDDAGNGVPDGDVGELLLNGPGLTPGYLNLPDATAALWEDGWLHTGDMFRRDADGLLHFVTRKKELVKSAGENVYPEEVEQVMRRHPAIKDCCVVGVPDVRFGEAVKGFVVLEEGASLKPVDVAEWCRASIAGYKRPRFVEFVDAIVRDHQGKPRRVHMAGLPVTPDQSTDVSTS